MLIGVATFTPKYIHSASPTSQGAYGPNALSRDVGEGSANVHECELAESNVAGPSPASPKTATSTLLLGQTHGPHTIGVLGEPMG